MSLLNVYESVLARLAALDSHAAEGARIRSRTRWVEEGEASTRYFFRMAKKHGCEEWISAMKNADGSLATSIPSICDSWVNFYDDLFRACPVDLSVQSELLDKLVSFVPAGEQQLCEGHFTVHEAFCALKGMAKAKAPGTDGFPAEFYLSFWNVLGADLVDVFNASLDSGKLPLSQREALISLILWPTSPRGRNLQ